MPDYDLEPGRSHLLVVDVQERFVPAIPAIAADQPVGKALEVLLRGAASLGVGVTISEQYPQGLGPTLPGLRALAAEAAVLPKTHFSVMGDDALRRHLDQQGKAQLVVCGIETHVCVLATVDDALRRGYQVVVVADAVASRSEANRDHALSAIRQLGALVLPVESVLLRWCRVAGTPTFKTISKLIR